MRRRDVWFAAAIAIAACRHSQATATPTGSPAVAQLPVAIPSHADGISRMIEEGMSRRGRGAGERLRGEDRYGEASFHSGIIPRD